MAKGKVCGIVATEVIEAQNQNNLILGLYFTKVSSCVGMRFMSAASTV